MKKSTIFFILTAISLILTIICIFFWSDYQNKADKSVWQRDSSIDIKLEVDMEMAQREYNQGTISYTEYQDKLNKINEVNEKLYENKYQDHANIMIIVSCCIGAITIILLITSIILKTKEKHS